MLSRRADIDITYENVNITADIINDLKSFSYVDNASGEADSISIIMKDDEKKWITSWIPKQGDIIKPKIKTLNWETEGQNQLLDCGIFIVDEPTFSGRPIKINIGAISTPVNNDFMTVPRSRTWEKVAIQKIAQTIADSSDLNLYYDTKYNPIIEFVEQSEQPNIGFLYDICVKNGLALKIYNSKIVIFREEEYESKQEIAAIDEKDMKSWSAKNTSTNTGYDACLLEYTLPNNQKKYSFTYRAPGRSGNKIFKLNETVYSAAEAERRTKAKLRELNKSETTLSIILPGNVNLLSSSNVIVTGLGIFNGKYYIDKAIHGAENGYHVQLELHKVLEGY